MKTDRLVLVVLGSALVAIAMLTSQPAHAGRLISWGVSTTNAPSQNLKQVSASLGVYAGSDFNLGLREDGSVIAWGNNAHNQCNVPLEAYDITQISAGGWHSLALRADGIVIAWGNNAQGQCDVPIEASFGDVVAVVAGGWHSLALRADGTVIAWGYNDQGQCDIPLEEFSQITAGTMHSVALRRDGTVMARGYNVFGQCNVPNDATNIMTIKSGGEHNLALRTNGTVVAWGLNSYGQASVPAFATNNVIAIYAGVGHNVIVKNGGQVLAWGQNAYGQCNIPQNLPSPIAISCGNLYTLLLGRKVTVTENMTVAGGKLVIVEGGGVSQRPTPVQLQYTDSLQPVSWLEMTTLYMEEKDRDIADSAKAQQRFYRIRQLEE